MVHHRQSPRVGRIRDGELFRARRGRAVDGQHSAGCPVWPKDYGGLRQHAASFNGLLSSGINDTTFGAATDTSITALARTTITAAESQLRLNKAVGEGLFWILGTPMITYGVDKLVGGTDSPVFLVQRNPDKFREGLIGGGHYGLGTRYVESRLLGRTTTKAYAKSAVGVCGFGSQMVPIFFGQGVTIKILRDPAKTNTEYSLEAAVSFAMVNPKNAEVISQKLT